MLVIHLFTFVLNILTSFFNLLINFKSKSSEFLDYFIEIFRIPSIFEPEKLKFSAHKRFLHFPTLSNLKAVNKCVSIHSAVSKNIN
jgi:hypothetical protein